MYTKALETKAEVVAGNVSVFNENKVYKYAPLNPMRNTPGSGEDFFTEVITEQRYTPMVYSYLYKRSYIEENQLRFFPGIIHEDELWTPVALITAKSVVSINDTTYYYRRHAASLTKSADGERRIKSIECVIQELTKFGKNCIYSKNCVQALKGRIDLLEQIKNHLNSIIKK